MHKESNAWKWIILVLLSNPHACNSQVLHTSYDKLKLIVKHLSLELKMTCMHSGFVFNIRRSKDCSKALSLRLILKLKTWSVTILLEYYLLWRQNWPFSTTYKEHFAIASSAMSNSLILIKVIHWAKKIVKWWCCNQLAKKVLKMGSETFEPLPLNPTLLWCPRSWLCHFWPLNRSLA